MTASSREGAETVVLLIEAAARLAFALWIGAVAGVASIAAPLVFAAVPQHIPSRAAAAEVIGPAFSRVDVLGLAACALVFAALFLRGSRPGSTWRRGVLGVLAACAALDGFVLAPRIIARQEPLATYHTLAMAAWVVILLLGGALIAIGLLPRASDAGAASRSPE